MNTFLHLFFQVFALPLSYACVIDISLLDKKPLLLFEEDSVIITSKLGDIVHIDTGYYDPKCVRYTLIKPNGDIKEINVNIMGNIHYTENKNHEFNPKNNSVDKTNQIDFRKPEILELYKYDQLIVGPLKEDDHGNWLLTKYIVDKNCAVNEIFKTVTIEIIENIEPTRKIIAIEEGAVLNISFPYAMQNVKMCELIKPYTTFDRYYTRDMEKPSNYCGYTIPNVTEDDQEVWSVVAIGKIVYRTSVIVRLSRPSFSTS